MQRNRATQWLLTIALAVCAFAPAAWAAEGPTVERFTLKNGLEVYVIPNHRIPAVSHMLWYRIGAADDPQGKSGLAHYHEHLMFKATGKLKSGEYSNIIARHGGQQNAFTGYDATSYYVDIAKEQLPLTMELEADRMRAIKPGKEEAIKEKEVIIEERRQRIENNPDALLAEQVNAALYRHHPYHLPVIGWLHEMDGLTPEDALEFHKRFYHPNNAILVVSGDITAKELKPLAEKYYGSLKSAPIPKRVWTEEPPQRGERHISMRHANVKQPSFSRNYATSSMNHGTREDALPLYVLSQLVAGGKTSRFYQSLAVEQKKVTAIDVSYGPLSLGPANFEISAIPEKGVSLEQLESAIDAELAKLLSGGITDTELARAKTQLKASSIFERDGLSHTARAVGWIAITGQDISYFTHWPEKIDAVTKQQVQAAAARALNKDASVTAYLLPEEKP